MRLRVHTLLLSLIFGGISAFPQSEVGGATLNGTVTDPSGAAVANAKITATKADTGQSRLIESGQAGNYTLVRLAPGRYDLTVEAPGFKTVKRPGVILAIGAVATFDIALEVGATQETVNVTAELPLVESTRSQTSTAVNEKFVRDLPINGRNFLDFTILTPGVVRDPRGGDLSFAGQRGTSNSLLVDGGDSNNLFFGQSSGRAGTRNPYTFSQEAVQEFQVNSAGYNAETGRAGGGVINVITKSGTNDFHGTGFWFFRDKALNANTFFNNSVGRRKQPYHFNQFGGNFSGPIKKNVLFFFYNFDGQRNTLPNAVFFPPNVAIPTDAVSQAAAAGLAKFQNAYTTGFENNIHTFKVDWNLPKSQVFNVRYNYHRFNGKNFENAGNQSASEHTGNSQNNTDNLAIQYAKVIGSNMVFDSRFIFLKDNAPGEANSTAPEAIIRQSGNTLLTIGRNNFSPRFTNVKKTNLINSVSLTRGKHTYKIGADLEFDRIVNFFPGNFSGAFTFDTLIDWANSRPAVFTQGFAGAGTNGATTYPNIGEYAFFAQDAWRVTPRLTLNYGVRYDLFTYAQPLVKNPDALLAAAKLDTSRINRDKNNLAPRFGFAYRLDETGKTVVRGGYGVYYGRTASILIGTAHSQNGIQVQTYTLSGANAAQAAIIPKYPAALSAPPTIGRTPDIYVVAPNYVQPQTHQWNFNLERQVTKDVALTLGYLGVRGVHLTRARDINLFPSALVQATISTGAATSFYAHPAGRPNPNFGRITLDDSGGDSVYHGVFIQATKRYSRNFQLQASYTFSKVIDSLPDQTSVVIGSDDAKVAQDTLNPNADRGLGDAHIPHRFVLSTVWDINYADRLSSKPAKYILGGYQLSFISSAQSGRWFSARTNVDLNNDGNRGSDRSPGFGRNTIEGPGFAAVDLRLSKDVPIYTERAKLRLIFEAFNAFNRANFTTINQTAFNYTAATRVFTPVATFRAPTNTADPRILQIALRLTF